jgi:hypothetical protein
MPDLLDDVRRMPDAAVRAAREIGDVPTPEHLRSLRIRVRAQHATELAAVHAALDQRFARTAEDCLDVFRTAAELAMTAQVAGKDLVVNDRWQLRRCWEALLAAR